MSDLRAALQASLGYGVDRELGGGGMSRVFVAHDQTLERDVVVKVLSPELAATLSAERFTREIRLAAALQDPHIVPLLAAGTTADGLPYYTMPFVRGDSLRARLAAGPVPMTQAIDILRNIAQALAHAHEHGVVHRDIKPENVLLSRGTAVVTDFGIAKALSLSTTQASHLTLTAAGGSVGTPAYMSPEQAVGDLAADHRADLYAWGVVAYELLAGTHPFARHTTPHAMVAAHISEAPKPLADVAPGVLPGHAALVMQCLAKAPEQRPASADELMKRLTADAAVPGALADASRQAAPARRGVRWRLAGAALVLVMVAALVWRQGGAGGSGASPSTTRTDAGAPMEALVVLPFESVGGDTANAYFAEGMADELSTALAKVPGLQLAGRSSAAVFRGKQVPPQEIGRALNVGGVLEGSVRRAGGRVRVSAQLTNATSGLVVWSETFEREARDVFAVQDDIARAIVNAMRMTLSGEGGALPASDRGTTDLEAYDLYQRGMYFYSRRGPGLARAREYLSQAIARDPAFARAHAGLALAWIQSGTYSNVTMRSVLPQANAAGERALALDSLSADSWSAVGMVRTYQRRWREADVASARALAIDPNNVQARFNRARLLLATGRIDEAVTEFLQGVALDPANPAGLATAAQSLTIAGRHREAAATVGRAWDIDSTISAVQVNGIVSAMLAGNRSLALQRANVVLRMPANMSSLGVAITTVAAAGDTAGALRVARDAQQRDARLEKVALVDAAVAEVRGDTATTLAALERLVETYDVGVVAVLSSHRFDWLRATPRFAAIVQSLDLDVARLTEPSGGRPR